MNVSKFLISTAAAATIVGAIGMAYAQTGGNGPGQSDPTQTNSTTNNPGTVSPNTTGGTTNYSNSTAAGTSANTGTSDTTASTMQADRN